MTLLQDVRFGFRMMAKMPMVTFIAVSSLALGTALIVVGVLATVIPARTLSESSKEVLETLY